jgi:murein L,D-transpeptidase YcbB/YkuD
MRRFLLRWTLLLLSLMAAAVPGRTEEPSVSARLVRQLPDPAARAGAAIAPSLTRQALEGLYQRRQGAPLWSGAGQPTAPARAVLGALLAASQHGLSPDDYRATALAARLEALTTARTTAPDEWAAFDVALSGAALRLLEDLHFGRIDPRAAGFDMPQRPMDELDAGALLERLAAGADTDAVLASVEPQYLHYRLLLQSLARYRELAAEDPPALPPLPRRSVKPGEIYTGTTALRRLLAQSGELSPQLALRSDEVLDADLAAALQRFQYLHGLREDGTLGSATLAALNVPARQRVRQIELTLERWRWVPPLKPPTLIVNIPQFRLFLIGSNVDQEADMLRMNVIVGRVYPQLHTPVFSAEMTAILFRPYWDVPPSIARRELLPELRRNPGYLEAQDMELAGIGARPATSLTATPENLKALAAGRLRLRQRPGPNNALGLIKFEMLNSYDVYLHSTPAQRLFDEPRRAFSHGCIRVSDPTALAAEVLRGAAGIWTPERIHAAMNGDETFRVPLPQPVHVLILYGTAVATEDGAVHFFEDLYGEDRRLERLLSLDPIASRR